MKFYDREEELKVLLEAYEYKKSEMVVITGRRRVGKTRLIDEFLKEKNGIKVLVVPKEESQVAADFVEAIKGVTGYAPPLNKMKDIMEYFFKEPKIKVLFIDEFSNFLEVNESIPYEIQKLWDNYKDKTNKLLITGGSYVSMMNKIFTKKKAPLFNRAGTSILLQPLDLCTIWQILTDINVKKPEEKIAAYCIFGGVPFYYELIEKRKKKNIYEIVNSLFFEIGAPLKEEGQNILRQEFGSAYKKYFATLEAINFGLVSMSKISNKLGIRPTTLSKYNLALQRDFKLVERLVPYHQSSFRSKKGLYRIKDNTIAFWFSLVYGKQTPITKEEIDFFISKRYEQFCIDMFDMYLKKKGERIKYAGKWWGSIYLNEKGEQREIDMVVETNDKLFVGEAKWINKKIGESELSMLKDSSGPLAKETKKKIIYVLFSKQGFTIKEKENVLLFDCERMDEIISGR